MQPVLWQTRYRKKRIEPDDLWNHFQKIRSFGQTIVSLNGSFDLLHAGHLQILFEAKQQGDILVVALNTDSSIQRYKSPKRPIVPLEFRLQMMAALEFVDFVTWFDETDPRDVLHKIHPHVHVNGADWGKECIEAETVRSLGARLHIVSIVSGLSTTQLLQKIQAGV